MTHLELLTRMVARYPASDVSDEHLMSMTDAVEHLDVEVLAYAINQAIEDPRHLRSNLDFPPSVDVLMAYRPRAYINATVGTAPVDRLAELPDVDRSRVLGNFKAAKQIPEGEPITRPGEQAPDVPGLLSGMKVPTKDREMFAEMKARAKVLREQPWWPTSFSGRIAAELMAAESMDWTPYLNGFPRGESIRLHTMIDRARDAFRDAPETPQDRSGDDFSKNPGVLWIRGGDRRT